MQAPRHTLYMCFDDEEPGKRVQTAEGMRDDHSSCFLALALVIWRTALLDLIHAGMHACMQARSHDQRGSYMYSMLQYGLCTSRTS